MPDARLAELASRHGIEPAYHDIWGNLRQAPDATLRALLAAMRIDAAGSDQVEAAIARHEREWRAQTLPPTLVVRQAALAGGVRLQLPLSLDHALSWLIAEESGHRLSGNFDARNLHRHEQFELDGEMRQAVMLPLPAALAPGYHRLAILDGVEPLAETALIVVPDQCYLPAAIAGGARVWGGVLQLYALRSECNWGIGDYSDLRKCTEQWAKRGAAIMGVSPLHALFPDNPKHASPYSPSSRLFFNVLYLDIESIEDFHESAGAREMARTPEFLAGLKRLRDRELIDYAGVAAVKLPMLELLYTHFRAHHLRQDSARASGFRAFCTAHGSSLRRHALFEAIQEHLRLGDPRIWGWQQWPLAYRDPESPAVTQFATEHAERVEFFEYLQWQADLQLAAVEQRCVELELGIGLYADLAVSVDRSGAEAWANQQMYALDASVGAPPDEFNLSGQDWGLPPLVPERLRACAYAPLIATLRANMARAGALRIDHVMGLARMYWVPAGLNATEGAYVRYPFADMLGIVALESHRNHCLVIGEDLGTVPPEVREVLQNAQVLSYRLLIFEREGASQFKTPSAYPTRALAAWSTHDLPTMTGYWRGQDLVVRDALGLFPDSSKRDAQVLSRAQERTALLLALEREGLLPPVVSLDPAAMPEATPEFILALHLYIARSPTAVMVVQFEDVIGVLDQANVPGTINEYPNWRRKLPLAIEHWDHDLRFSKLAEALSLVRGRVRIA